MICDNCGARMDKSEEYCPNCGIDTSDMHPVKKNKYYKKSRSSNKSRPSDKPIKQKYIKKSRSESYDYSQYVDANQYESSNRIYKEKKKKSNTGLMIILLLIALALGFTVGLIMFTSLLIPGIN